MILFRHQISSTCIGFVSEDLLQVVWARFPVPQNIRQSRKASYPREWNHIIQTQHTRAASKRETSVFSFSYFYLLIYKSIGLVLQALSLHTNEIIILHHCNESSQAAIIVSFIWILGYEKACFASVVGCNERKLSASFEDIGKHHLQHQRKQTLWSSTLHIASWR